MKKKIWLSIFIVPIFALLQVLVTFVYRQNHEEEQKAYNRQEEIYSQNQEKVVELTGRKSPGEIEKIIDNSGVEMVPSSQVEVIKLRRVEK